jgi:hypothetical protein
MRRTVTALALLAGLAPVAASAQADARGRRPTNDPPVASPCAAVAVSSPDIEGGVVGTRNRFSASEVVDIDIWVLLSDTTKAAIATGDHVLEYRVSTPSGALYQALHVPVSSDPARGGQTQAVLGYPRALTIVVPEARDYQGRRLHGVPARLAVAGTTVTASSLYGEWTVEVLLDGARLPCDSGVAFTIGE